MDVSSEITLSARQIERVRDSFVRVLFLSDEAAARFYARLFELAPETRGMFRGDLREQGRNLISALATIVTGLSRLETMLPTIHDLAIRHVGYGVREYHYAAVGDALMHMLTELVGPDFDHETAEAWSRAYDLLSEAMIGASRRAAA